MKTKECLNCSKNYETERSTAKYCSRKCKLEYHEKHSKRKAFLKVCQNCGREFTTTRGNTVFCCHQCSADYRSYNKKCLYCGKQVKRPSRDYCSKKCFAAVTRKPRPLCPICGKEVSHHYSITCSIKCMAELRRYRRLEEIRSSIENGDNISPFYNKKACEWFDKFDQKNNTIGQHAECGGERHVRGYWLDYINDEKKLIIEWNEKQHYDKNGFLKRKDMRKIEAVLEELPEYEYWVIKEDNMIINKFNFSKDINNILFVSYIC